jgi:hypothetical protein
MFFKNCRAKEEEEETDSAMALWNGMHYITSSTGLLILHFMTDGITYAGNKSRRVVY